MPTSYEIENRIVSDLIPTLEQRPYRMKPAAARALVAHAIGYDNWQSYLDYSDDGFQVTHHELLKRLREQLCDGLNRPRHSEARQHLFGKQNERFESREVFIPHASHQALVRAVDTCPKGKVIIVQNVEGCGATTSATQIAPFVSPAEFGDLRDPSIKGLGLRKQGGHTATAKAMLGELLELLWVKPNKRWSTIEREHRLIQRLAEFEPEIIMPINWFAEAKRAPSIS